MLDAILTLSFDPTGGTTPVSRVYKKEAHEVLRANFKETVAQQTSSPYADNIILHIAEPKRTAAFYGTRRHFVNMRQESTVATPAGETIAASLFKLETSIPVGISAADKLALFERFKALLVHEIFEAFFISNEC